MLYYIEDQWRQNIFNISKIPDWVYGVSNLLFNGNWGSLLGGKASGVWSNHTLTSSAEITNGWLCNFTSAL